MKRIMKCEETGNYTMKEISPWSKKPTVRAIPPKYSPADKYARHRRQYKEEHNA